MTLKRWECQPKNLHVKGDAKEGWCYVDRKRLSIYLYSPGNLYVSEIPMSKLIEWVDRAKLERNHK